MYSAFGKKGFQAWITERSRFALFQENGEGDLIDFSPMTPITEGSADRDYPMKAVIGSVWYHLGSGTRTSCSSRIGGIGHRGDVEISIEDSDRLGIESLEKVRISSPYGRIERGVKIVKSQKPGFLFIPKAVHNNDARNLLALTSLEARHSPGLMEINVRIEKI
jgi:predicted molibdopterin-dependent oxidoreductase YjgC